MILEILSNGGLSGSYVYQNETDRQAYMKDVFKTIINRDLVNKCNLPDTLVLNKLAEFMMDNVSNLSSPNNIIKMLSLNVIATDHVKIEKYVIYIMHSLNEEGTIYDSISNADTFDRGVSSLLQIKYANKILIARTRHPDYQYEGIRMINLGEVSL